jgi:hypothetical protein
VVWFSPKLTVAVFVQSAIAHLDAHGTTCSISSKNKARRVFLRQGLLFHLPPVPSISTRSILNIGGYQRTYSESPKNILEYPFPFDAENADAALLQQYTPSSVHNHQHVFTNGLQLAIFYPEI